MANNNNSGKNQSELRRCAFCGRNEHQVNFLIPSPTGIYICDFCVDACDELINQTLEEEDFASHGDASGMSLTLETLPKPAEIKAGGFDKYFVDHTLGIYPASATGEPFTAAYVASKGDPVTDLMEDLAAEQKARTTYDNILRLSDDPDVNDVIRFLREREVVHFQRFGDILRRTQETLNQKNFYAFNPSYNACPRKNARN